MSKLRIIFAILLAAVMSQPVQAATGTAMESLQKMTAKLRSAKSITAEFSLVSSGYASGGKIVMSGGKFTLDTPKFKVWYDGQTQWAYMIENNEVNVSEPGTDELMQINPLGILGALGKNYTARRLKSPSGKEVIELVPGKKSDFRKVTLTLNSSTSMPEVIEATTADNMEMKVTVRKLSIEGEVNKSQFIFNPKLFPGVDIVDLR